MNKLSDEKIMKLFQLGDNNCYTELVSRYKDRLFNYICYFVHDIDLAEDLLQDTFLKLYTHKNSYREISKLSTWLYTIAGNLAKTELRKKKRRKTFSTSELSYEDKEFVIEDTSVPHKDMLDEEQQNKKIMSCLHAIPLDFRTMIILRDIQELSYDEISLIVGAPLGTIKSRINRARIKLFECVKRKDTK